MEYKDYAAEDFLADESFQNFCLGRNDKDVNFWEAWIAANPGKYEEVRQAKELYFLLNGNVRPAEFRVHRQLFEAMVGKHVGAGAHEEDIPGTAPRKSRNGKRLVWFTAVAAASVLAFVFIPRFAKKPVLQPVPLQFEYSQASKVGERKSFQLPDGSKVMLNAGSTINIAPDFNEASREITLEGEAFFDVTHNPQKPFIIHTSSMDVKVLGTTFNVKAYPTDKVTETSLIKGSVQITLNKGRNKTIILHPNEKIILPNGEDGNKRVPNTATSAGGGEDVNYKIADLTYVDNALVETSWTQNRLVFNDNSFEEIAANLGRWYNVSIKFGDETVKDYRFTATFDQKTITQILDALQLSRHFDYKIEENNQIVIHK